MTLIVGQAAPVAVEAGGRPSSKRQEVTEELSNKFKIVSLISIVLILFIHSHNAVTESAGHATRFTYRLNRFIQDIISDGVARVAVPMFFFISGYLFFINFRPTIADYFDKVKKRTRTVLVPYLLWSCFGILLFFLLQQFPGSERFFSSGAISKYSILQVIEAIFLNPLPYQLWFLKSLFILVLASPLIYLLSSKFGWAWITALTLSWMLHLPFPKMIFGFEFDLGILFFSIGCVIAIGKRDYGGKDLSQLAIWALGVWLLLIVTHTMIAEDNMHEQLSDFSLKASQLAGTFAFWKLFDRFSLPSEKIRSILLKLTSFSFFIFAFHEPILTITKKSLFFVFGKTDSTSLAIYFAAPVLVLGLSLVAASLAKKAFFPFYTILVGGRGSVPLQRTVPAVIREN